MRDHPSDARQAGGGIRPHAYVVGALLLTGLLALTPYSDYFVRGSYMANHHVPVAASVVLLVLCVGRGLRPSRGSRTLDSAHARGSASRRELAVIWAMVATSSGIASAGLMRFLIPTLPALHFLATPENRWEEALWPHVPSWVAPTDERALRWFYDGAPSGGGVPWAAWAGPVACWSAVALLIWGLLLCLATLLRKQWIEHERMTFVHVQLPLALIEEPEPGRRLSHFLGDRLMWLGFALPFVLYGITGLTNYFPAMPTVGVLYPNFYSKAVYFDGRPWDAASPLFIALFPSTIGFGFLLTTEVSLSAWVFFVLSKLQAVLISALGLELKSVTSGYGAKQFTAYQDMGVYLALVGMSLWVARKQLGWGVRRGDPGGSEFRFATESSNGKGSRESEFAPTGSSSRAPILLALLALVVLIALFGSMGMSTGVALGFVVAYLITCTGVSWMTSNTGVLQLPVVFRPEDYMISCIGTRNLRAQDLALLAIPSRAFSFYYNEMLMPHFLNHYKLAHETGVPRPKLVGAMVGAVVLGLTVAWVAHLTLAYSKGAYALQNMSYIDWPRTPFQAAAAYISQPSGPDPLSFVFIPAGAAAFALVSALRSSLPWWPLHPAGMLIGSTMQEYWLSLFVAWACKVLILRYGGGKLYQRARVYFLGMVMGEAAIACVWIAVGLVTKTGVRLLP